MSRVRSFLLLAALGLAPTVAIARSTAPAVIVSPADSLLVLVESRQPAEIRADLEAGLQARARADDGLARAKTLQARSRSYVELKKHELESIKVRLDLAKKEKDLIAKHDLDAQKKHAELEMALLKQRDELRTKEMEAAKARRELADVTGKTFEIELVLAGKRSEMTRLGGQAMSMTLAAQIEALHLELRGLEERILRAQIDEAERRERLVKQEGEVAKQRLKVFEAQGKLPAAE